jgi:hypothetical protein
MCHRVSIARHAKRAFPAHHSGSYEVHAIFFVMHQSCAIHVDYSNHALKIIAGSQKALVESSTFFSSMRIAAVSFQIRAEHCLWAAQSALLTN